MKVSRRQFLNGVGKAGGYSAVFTAMQGLGLIHAEPLPPAKVEAPTGVGTGKKVVVLGAGIAGLVAAYELRQLGFEPIVLEAKERPGGRNWTVRGGDTIRLNDGSVQSCDWDAENYQNFGPARLPSIHTTMLGYCKKLGVKLEVEVNTCRAALLQNDNANGGKPVTQRHAINDFRGHFSELLSKCVHQGALDQELTSDDRQRMLDFLRIYGPLDKQDKYVGSDRAGYAKIAVVGNEKTVLEKPVDLHTLLVGNFWLGMLWEEVIFMQATMFQPVGGMDQIPKAFAKSLGGVVLYNAPVTEIRKSASGVKVGYKHEGQTHEIQADYCICALPLPTMQSIPNDFSKPVQNVIANVVYGHSYKIAWESRRFWEQDYGIYGGLEFLEQGCSPIWYPSGGTFSERGVFVAGYADEAQTGFEKFTFPEKLQESRKAIEKLHPGHSKEMQKPIYVGWGKVPYQGGSWLNSYGPLPPGAVMQHGISIGQPDLGPGYEVLIEPDGLIYFAGDHVSRLIAWQEGAAQSAIRVVQQISDRVKLGKGALG